MCPNVLHLAFFISVLYSISMLSLYTYLFFLNGSFHNLIRCYLWALLTSSIWAFVNPQVGIFEFWFKCSLWCGHILFIDSIVLLDTGVLVLKCSLALNRLPIFCISPIHLSSSVFTLFYYLIFPLFILVFISLLFTWLWVGNSISLAYAISAGKKVTLL